MNESFKHYSKRLADYVRMYIEIGVIKNDSSLGIAYRDFMEEWKLLEEANQKDSGNGIKPNEILECPSCHATGQAEVFRR